MHANIRALWHISARSTVAAAVVLTCGLSMTACTRTGDGSMLLSRPSMSLGFGRWTERFAERRRERIQQAAAPTTFPAAPPPPIVETAPEPQATRPAPVRRAAQPARIARRSPVRASDVHAPRIGVKPPFQASPESGKPLTCTDMAQAAQSSGRVKVSCQ